MRSCRRVRAPPRYLATIPPSIRLGTIATGPFAAVVGDGPRAACLGRREELAPQLLAYQRTIEQIMRATKLLPVKFGTVVPDTTSVRTILERGGPAFAAAFGRLDGCVQVEILVTWNIEAVFAEIARDEAVADCKSKLQPPAGAPDGISRTELGRLVKDALERRRVALAEPLSDALRQVAVDAIAYPATADHVVVHVALLIKAGSMAALDRCLETLDAANGGSLTFRCIGPLAPYGFATVEVEIVDAAALAEARSLLEIGAGANAAAVHRAYCRLARTVHPDSTGASAGANASMSALTTAYRMASLNAEPAGGPLRVSVRRHDGAFDVAD